MTQPIDRPKQVPDVTAMDVFHFDEGRESFEDFGRENGFRHWFASDLGAFLGYESFDSFRKAVNRAMAACAALNIPCEENFSPLKREVDGKTISDFRLSRFACYLSAMNGYPKKPKVALAQAYFATMAEGFRQYLQDAEDIERLNLREDLRHGEKSLAGIAKQAQVTNYAFFQNAGYRGMYNMNLAQLKTYKGHQGGDANHGGHGEHGGYDEEMMIAHGAERTMRCAQTLPRGILSPRRQDTKENIDKGKSGVAGNLWMGEPVQGVSCEGSCSNRSGRAEDPWRDVYTWGKPTAAAAAEGHGTGSKACHRPLAEKHAPRLLGGDSRCLRFRWGEDRPASARLMSCSNI